MFFRFFAIITLSVLSASCASTSMIDSWLEEDSALSYKRLMIIGISDSQQTRQLYEKHFVASLKAQGIEAVPSYRLINSKQKITRDTVVAAIDGTDIDAVLVTYRVADDAEFQYDISLVNEDSQGQEEENLMSATIVSKRGYSRSDEVFMLKSDLYAVATSSLIWSAQTKSVGPESVDQVIIEVSRLLIDQLIDDGLLE